MAAIFTVKESQGDSCWVRSPLKSNLCKTVEERQHGWGHSGPALNENSLPEDSANVDPSEEDQIRQDEQGSGKGTEEGNTTSLHGCREMFLNKRVNR